jgi:hypothetical protein
VTTINPTSIGSATLLRRSGHMTPTTDHLRALVARRLNQPLADGLNLSGGTRGVPGLTSIGDARQGLGEVSTLLDQLKEQVNRLASGQASADDAQKAIDDLVTSIDDAAQRTGLGGFGGDGFSVLDVARQVTNLSVYNVNLKPGQEQKVEIDIRASAQQAGLFIDFAGGALDLDGPNRSFTIEVEGRNGAREFTFSSGASAESIANSINAFAKQTGVEARLSGTGVRLESIATGSAEFTSLRVLDDGGAADEAGKIYRFRADNASELDPDTFMTFDSIIGDMGIRDRGEDAEVWVNGQKAAVYGSEVLASNGQFTALFYLDRLQEAAAGPDAQRLGSFHGFTIKADGQIVPVGADGTGRDLTPGAPGENADPRSADGIDEPRVRIPPLEDYGGPRTPDSDLPQQPPAIDLFGPGSGVPRTTKDDDATTVEDGGDRPGVGATDPTRPAIDAAPVRAAIDRLMQRIGARTDALNLIEKMGLDVVPASLRAAAGSTSPADPGLDFQSALGMARSIREGMFGVTGRQGDFAGGTTSAQVLRLLGVDGHR